MSNPDQLPLGLALNAGQGIDDLVVSHVNRDAVTFINSWPNWPVPIVILAGPVGVGKSHLAAIWAERAAAATLQPSGDLAPEPEDSGANFVVEDIGPGNFDETALFHLINNVRAHGGNLLLTSRTWPGNWGMELPDLTSRMKLARLIELSEPDDLLLRGVMTKLFADRQLDVDGTVIDYMVLRMERSLACAQDLVTRLDDLSMAQKRAITKPLAAEALRQLGLQE
ncbi:MAG: hypothetical protein ABJM29_04880 [Rhizobiaceae bacterium]